MDGFERLLGLLDIAPERVDFGRRRDGRDLSRFLAVVLAQ